MTEKPAEEEVEEEEEEPDLKETDLKDLKVKELKDLKEKGPKGIENPEFLGKKNQFRDSPMTLHFIVVLFYLF